MAELMDHAQARHGDRAPLAMAQRAEAALA